ncbi:carboxylesterase/lipase family protein [Ramlibacter sp. MMS24-I3-19]|uniref:carboxylesterase/lipase family protein n=1 Tax=Ramlibacter sp. MMS24-I3-19 TaxID=3416606 RepID=UPI003D092816
MVPILRLAACLALSVPLLAAAGPQDAKTERQTQFGPIVGSDETSTNGTYSWKGVPFAAPPVGNLRWAPPVDPVAWTTTKETKTFGNACVQYGRIYGPGANNRFDATIGTTLNQAVGNEDCLYLNIWRPSNQRTELPVIVFVHGGSNVSGYTADPVYDGAALAKTAQAVVVTVNYRLGIFGFLNQPFLKTGDPANDSGNFALLDIIKGLEFVQQNAREFGGNPNSVTLMGQSAGAINVWALIASPLVQQHQPQLFHRLAPMSGGMSMATDLPAGSIPTLSPESTYALQGNALLQQQLIAAGKATDVASANTWIAANGAAQAATFLRSQTPSSLLNTLLFRLAALGLAGSGPIPDGYVLSSGPVNAIKAGNYLHVPVLASNTRDEGKLFPSFLPLVGGSGNARKVTDAQLFDIQFHTDPEHAQTTTLQDWITASYLPVDAPVTGFTARADLLNRVFFLRSRDNIMDALKTRQQDVWYYRFDWDEEPAPWNDIYGAAHLYDLPFIFGTFGPSVFGNVSFDKANAPGRIELSKAMMRSLSAFARNGDPNAPDALGVNWPTWPGALVYDATRTEKAISTRPNIKLE